DVISHSGYILARIGQRANQNLRVEAASNRYPSRWPSIRALRECVAADRNRKSGSPKNAKFGPTKGAKRSWRSWLPWRAFSRFSLGFCTRPAVCSTPITVGSLGRRPSGQEENSSKRTYGPFGSIESGSER